MNILGISAYYHDSSAALGGSDARLDLRLTVGVPELVAHYEEETGAIQPFSPPPGNAPAGVRGLIRRC